MNNRMILVNKDNAYTDDEILLLMLKDGLSKQLVEILVENQLELIYKNDDSYSKVVEWLANNTRFEYEEALESVADFLVRRHADSSPVLIITNSIIESEIYECSSEIESFDEDEYSIFISEELNYIVSEVLFPTYSESDRIVKELQSKISEIINENL
jgi:hypothetical protein